MTVAAAGTVTRTVESICTDSAAAGGRFRASHRSTAESQFTDKSPALSPRLARLLGLATGSLSHGRRRHPTRNTTRRLAGQWQPGPQLPDPGGAALSLRLLPDAPIMPAHPSRAESAPPPEPAPAPARPAAAGPRAATRFVPAAPPLPGAPPPPPCTPPAAPPGAGRPRPAAAPCARPVGSASSSWSAAAEEEEAWRWGRLGRGIGPRGRCRAGGREHLPGVLVGSRRARVGRGMCWGGHGWVTWRGGQAEDTVTSAWCVCVCGP